MTKSMGGSNPELLSITVIRSKGEHMFVCLVYCEILVSLAAVYVSSHNRAPRQKGGALSDETKTAARQTRSSLTRPQSSVFGSHT